MIIKKIFLILSGLIILTLGLSLTIVMIYPKFFQTSKITNFEIVTELPSEIERTNPVPEVRHWDSDNRTFYYFNWGLKPTTGYSLNPLSVKNNKIILQANTPDKDSINAQVMTYPYLLLSLPKGEYQFEVVDNKHRPLKDIFLPKNPPLRLNLFLPSALGKVFQRVALRDPYLNNEGKTTAQIALEALFAQEEMLEYLEHEVFVERVSFSTPHRKWYVLLTPGYQTLAKPKGNY